ncbi:MAG: hypothetical protein ACOC1U_06095, partial [Spirochaetota bacterium]
MKGRRSIPRAVARAAAPTLLLAALLAGCGLGLPTDLPAPAEVTATTNEIDQITVTWTAVAGASRYYIYRSETSDPFVLEDGDYGPVPYTSTNLTTFTDPTSSAQTFSYRVSAIQQHTGDESPL